MDIPFAVTKASEEAFEGAGVLEGSEFAKEAQAFAQRRVRGVYREQTTEQGGEYFDVDEEVVPGGDPSFAIE